MNNCFSRQFLYEHQSSDEDDSFIEELLSTRSAESIGGGLEVFNGEVFKQYISPKEEEVVKDFKSKTALRSINLEQYIYSPNKMLNFSRSCISSPREQVDQSFSMLPRSESIPKNLRSSHFDPLTKSPQVRINLSKSPFITNATSECLNNSLIGFPYKNSGWFLFKRWGVIQWMRETYLPNSSLWK